MSKACRSLGIPAEISGRNDILTNGCKFSGNSFYSHNGCSFHNGTLLLSVDMANLGKYLTPSRVKLESKGVASVRSRVINLTELRPSLTVAEMADAMVKAAETVYGLKASMLSEADFDEAEIEKRYQRFSSFDWNYGKSVPCTFECARRFSWGRSNRAAACEKRLLRGRCRLLRRDGRRIRRAIGSRLPAAAASPDSCARACARHHSALPWQRICVSFCNRGRSERQRHSHFQGKTRMAGAFRVFMRCIRIIFIQYLHVFPTSSFPFCMLSFILNHFLRDICIFSLIF